MSLSYFPQHASEVDSSLKERLQQVRYLVTDMDGTLFSGSSILCNTAGEPCADLAQTIVRVNKSPVELLACTGRNRAMLSEDARLCGMKSWIGEMGGLICTHQQANPEWEYFTADMDFDPKSGKTPHDLILETGILDSILGRWPGQIETYHDNGIGYELREVTLSMRGFVDYNELKELVESCPLPLEVSDNGLVKKVNGATKLDCDPLKPNNVHSLQIAPRGLNKGSGLKRFMELRNIKKEEILALGDSPADCALAEAAGIFVLMNNGTKDPQTLKVLEDGQKSGSQNYIARAAVTDGWVETVSVFLDTLGF